ncbi:HNH endonuclease [Streptomyces sp. NBC_01717]|uniref:HNH endonuclease n=1 Tax=Streptomyces sp. NBC_01717 TaxID=2975918 RepID=UPI002E354753|nr:hypothetical protein [Streptomyces sp. NBC_01717]
MDFPQKELIARLLADTCEICGSKGNVRVHHVRALTNLAHAGWQPSDWARVMLHRRSKTVVACDVCHDRIHFRTASQIAHAVVTGEPDDRETVMSGSAGGRAEQDSPHGEHLTARPTQPAGS